MNTDSPAPDVNSKILLAYPDAADLLALLTWAGFVVEGLADTRHLTEILANFAPTLIV